MDEERDRSGDEGASDRADEMEDRARRMEGRSSELERDIGEAKEDWRSKKTGGTAPGAQSEDASEDLVDESEEPEEFDLSDEAASDDSDSGEGSGADQDEEQS